MFHLRYSHAMISHIRTIGVHKIIVPEPKDIHTQLLFADGQALAGEVINENLVQGLIKGTAKIVVLIPEHIRHFTDNGTGGSTVMAEFYMGLFELMLEQVRDELFPELKPQANRDKIFEVGKKAEDLKDIVEFVFHTAWVTYDPLERFINDKIQVGLLHPDGSYSLVHCDEERVMTNPLEEGSDLSHRLSYFAGKYYKGLDGMFMNNLRSRDLFIDEDKSDPAHLQPQGRKPKLR